MKGILDSIILISCILALIIGGIIAGSLLEQNDITFSSLLPLNENENYSIEDCQNKSLSETAYCLRDYVETFYNYTERDERDYIGNQGSLEDVKLNGGDCHDYTFLYQEMFDQLDFKTEKVSIFPDDNSGGHTFLVVWDKNLTGYCNIDMLNIDCASFGKDGDFE